MIIQADNITLAYDGRKVVQNLSFSVDKGDYLCIVGENGTGKSTLIKAILGLHPVKEGKITYSDFLNKNEIGYLPQQNQIQKDFPASVSEIVLSGCQNKLRFLPFYKKSHKQRAKSTMEKLEILHLKNTCYEELSGGQKQRVLLSRALCATDKILVLDEPSAGLDPIITSQLYKIIEDLRKTDNMTIIMVSHDMENVLKYGNKILHLTEDSYIFDTKDNYVKSHLNDMFKGGQNNA